MSVGLDVHARSVAAAAIDGVTGELRQARLTPSHDHIRSWIEGLDGPAAVVYEAGPTGFGLYRSLAAAGVRCVVAAPSKLQRPSGDRVKTDKLDAIWLAKVAERGICRPSLVQPEPIRHLRDLTRYRRSLIRDRTREMQRAEKLLEDAQIKLSSVVTELFGVSGRAMMAALIQGQRDPKVLAQMAKGQLRRKIAVLEEALQGFFTDHLATILAMMLDNVDRLSTQITALDQSIETAIAPYARQVAQLDEITCVSTIGAQELIAELGVDMSRFPSAPQLVSWAKFCPQAYQSAGRSTPKGRGKGNPWLAVALGNIAASASRTDTFLGARYRRIAKRRGVQKAIVASGNTVLTIAWHLLADPNSHYRELGGDYYQRHVDTERRARTLARQLQELTGQNITIRDGRAVLSDAA